MSVHSDDGDRSCDESAGGGDGWRRRLRTALRGAPTPVFALADTNLPAATVWAGSRIWVDTLRTAGLSAVEPCRVVVALPPSPALLQCITGLAFEGHSLVTVPADADPARLSAAVRSAVDGELGVVVAGSGSLWADWALSVGALPLVAEPTGAPVAPCGRRVTVERRRRRPRGARLRGVSSRAVAWEISDTAAWRALDRGRSAEHCADAVVVLECAPDGRDSWLRHWLPAWVASATVVYTGGVAGHAVELSTTPAR